MLTKLSAESYNAFHLACKAGGVEMVDYLYKLMSKGEGKSKEKGVLEIRTSYVGISSSFVWMAFP